MSETNTERVMRPRVPSERQIRCLRLKSEGATVADIAEKCGVSVGTISREMYAVCCLLGVSNTTAAVAVGLEEGWLKVNG